VRWLGDSSRVSAARRPEVSGVYARLLEIVEGVHANLLSQWGDPRLVWLPMQLALTEDRYDEQLEVDGLIERAVHLSNGLGDRGVQRFTDRNALTYLRSSDLPLEIARSIFATRDYHVLWTHDFTGRRDQTRELDEIAYTLVADAYLPALTRAVQRYDSARHMPLYLLLQDQFYYEQRDGRVWMDILENPLEARISLPAEYREWETHLRERQRELRDAVARSWLLQQDATANGGQRWLRRAVKVHVSILLPSDFSFRSHHILPPFPFIPDNVMRDHRKLVLYDLDESDPYGGALIIMGVGVGEHYASATWEDRGYRVRGPAALEARAAVRRALRANGLREVDLPPPLRSDTIEVSDDTTRSIYVGRALQVHNEAGFGAKRSSVARAMLYNLAPAGGVIIVPDPLWVSETWAAMLAGAAARGCKVYVIAPSLANNPNPHAPIVAVMHDVMGELLAIGRRLEGQIASAGGELRVGLYTAAAQVTDAEGRQREVRQGLRRYPWIRDVFPFDDNALALLDRATVQSEADGDIIADDETSRAPQLHQKTQLVARPGAIAALVRQPGWEDVLARALRVQSRQSARFADEIAWTTPDVDSAATRSADTILRGYEQTLSESDRKAVSFYFSLGTQNQDPRGIMLDGEATLIVSGLHAAAGVVDLFHIMTRSTWLEGETDLDRLLPRPGGLLARFARLIRLAL
jgi:phosphatidylserine/phosphatidylglycerophosphate/cardiolipin synthase-like enzyme